MVGTFVLIGLGVWVVVRILKEEVTAPDWFFMALAVGFSALGLWWTDWSPLWCPVVAGFAHGWHRVDGLFQSLVDRVRIGNLTRGPRR